MKKISHWEEEHLEYLKTGIIKNRIPSLREDYYYKKYGITDDEIRFINTLIRPIEISYE